MARADGIIPSPNIWNQTNLYEVYNRGLDPDGRIDAALRSLIDTGSGRRAGWQGKVVVDIGCGAGFHLPTFATSPPAAHVIGVEPRPELAEAARRRAEALPQGSAAVEVLAGTAQALPLADASVDLLHARWAYFFGPGCESGLAEAERVARPGALMVVIDTDATRSTVGCWFARAHPRYDPAAVERFWRRVGFSRVRLDVRWELPDRSSFEAVVRMELPPHVASDALGAHDGTQVDAAVNLFWKRYGGEGADPTHDVKQ